MSTGLTVLGKKSMIEQELADFIEYLTTHVSNGTLILYINHLTRWIRYVSNIYKDANILYMNGNLNPNTAQAYLNMLTKADKSPSTVCTAGHAIKKFLVWKGIYANIKLDVPQIKFGEPKYISLDRINEILGVCSAPLEILIITLLFDSAIRISELLNLELQDIDWNTKIITVTRKGGKRDDVNISDKSIDALKTWLSIRRFSSERVFGDLDYQTVWRLVKNIGKRIGIKLHPHMFRHSRAVHLLKSRVPIHVVSQHLGHRNIGTTINIYGRFTAIDLKKYIVDW